MKYRPYPAYRDSAVEWLGRVPSHWTVERAKFVARLESGHTPSRQHPEYWVDCHIPWFSLADVWQLRDDRTEVVYETEEKISELGLLNSAARLLPAGTVMVSRTASVGFSALMGTQMATTQDFVNWVCGPRMRPEFLLYVFRAMRAEFERLVMGSTHQTIYMPDVGQFVCPVPPRPEQDAIVTWIRRETERVDALVTKKERLIELLQDERTAFINYTVSRGLQPRVPMQGSGIDGLDVFPAHWQVRRLKRIAAVRQGITKGRDLQGRATIERPYLRVANVQSGRLDLSDVHSIEVGLDEVGRYELRVGDVLMNEGGDNDKLGRGTVWEGQIPGCLHQNHVFAVRPHDPSLSRWIATITLAEYARFFFLGRAKQSTNLASISSTNVQELPVLIPPPSERTAILEALNERVQAIDALVAKIREAIERLKEYRTALISSAVTGKIDVRGEVAIAR